MGTLSLRLLSVTGLPFTWSSEPGKGPAVKAVLSVLSYSNLSIGPVPGIEPTTSRSAVKRWLPTELILPRSKSMKTCYEQSTLAIPIIFFLNIFFIDFSVKNYLILYAKQNRLGLESSVSCLKQGSEMSNFCLKQQGRAVWRSWRQSSTQTSLECPPRITLLPCLFKPLPRECKGIIWRYNHSNVPLECRANYYSRYIQWDSSVARLWNKMTLWFN